MSSISTNKFKKYALGFGTRFRKARKNKGLSQQNVGDALRLKRNTISNYENEKSYPSFDILAKLVLVLGVTSDHLIGINLDPNLVFEPKKKYSEPYNVLQQKYSTLEKKLRAERKKCRQLESQKEGLEKALKILGGKLPKK